MATIMAACGRSDEHGGHAFKNAAGRMRPCVGNRAADIVVGKLATGQAGEYPTSAELAVSDAAEREADSVAEYAALGIGPDTWACVAKLDKREADKYVLALARSGVPALLSLDPDGKRWHVAVRGGLRASPTAWIVSLRGEPYETVQCPDTAVTRGGQHPQALHGLPVR